MSLIPGSLRSRAYEGALEGLLNDSAQQPRRERYQRHDRPSNQPGGWNVIRLSSPQSVRKQDARCQYPVIVRIDHKRHAADARPPCPCPFLAERHEEEENGTEDKKAQLGVHARVLRIPDTEFRYGQYQSRWRRRRATEEI